MGTIITKDTRRISFDNTISVNPLLIKKPVSDCDELIAEDFSELQQRTLMFNDTTNYTKMHDEEQDYWAQRIDNLKNEHEVINSIIEDEYNVSIQKANKLFESQKVTNEKIQKLRPCLDWRARIVRCYEDNPRQPLVCSNLVQAFNDCVAQCQLSN